MDNSNEEKNNSWIDMIRNTKDCFIELCYIDSVLVGFINYMYYEDELMLSELLSKNNDKYKSIYVTINDKNKHSKEVFEHIGFINTKNNLYEISYSKLKTWIDKKNK